MPNNLQKILNDFLNFSMFLFTGFDFQIFLELTSLCYNPSLSSSHLQQARSNGTKSSQPPTYGNQRTTKYVFFIVIFFLHFPFFFPNEFPIESLQNFLRFSCNYFALLDQDKTEFVENLQNLYLNEISNDTLTEIAWI